MTLRPVDISGQPPVAAPDLVKRAVCEEYGINARDLTGTSRFSCHCLPRFVAMALVRDLTGRSLSQIGRDFGGRDHTTVRNALQRVEDMQRRCDGFRARYDALKLRIEAMRSPMFQCAPVFRSVRGKGEA